MSESRSLHRVQFKSNPDLVVFVGALSALEAIEFSQRLQAIEKSQDMVAEQLCTWVRNEDGSPRFADGAAALAFLKTIRPGQLKTILKAAQKYNELNDEAIEEELKN